MKEIGDRINKAGIGSNSPLRGTGTFGFGGFAEIAFRYLAALRHHQFLHKAKQSLTDHHEYRDQAKDQRYHKESTFVMISLVRVFSQHRYNSVDSARIDLRRLMFDFYVDQLLYVLHVLRGLQLNLYTSAFRILSRIL
ncbi:hypothetical protein MJD09_22300 [bacterium]|nr:hypothetical protein [bacterium]